MADDQTLLAHIAPRLGYGSENIAVESLGYVLSASKEARSALKDVLGLDGAPICRVRTQAGDAERSVPDLAGYDEDSAERVLIEAKFWAGLTERQPVKYLERLKQDKPSALLFVAPAARIESLWAELRTRVDEADELEWHPILADKDTRSAAVGGNRRLLLTSWANLLRRIASSVSETSRTAEDIRQLIGLTQRMDKEAFLPLRQAELGPEFPRRMRGLVTLIRNAVDCGCADGWADASRLSTGIGSGGEEGDWGRYFRLGGGDRAGAWLGWRFEAWAKQRETPLWLVLEDWGRDDTILRLHELRPRLARLLNHDTPGIIDEDYRLLVPITLPLGVEETAVVGAVVAQLDHIAAIISGSES